MGRFAKGQSGNPNGRPRTRRPNVSAFDIVFDKRLTVTESGVERELSVDEALQFKTYEAALKGSKPAEMAMEQPREFKLVLNLKTAKALGLAVPPAIRVRADAVIE